MGSVAATATASTKTISINFRFFVFALVLRWFWFLDSFCLHSQRTRQLRRRNYFEIISSGYAFKVDWIIRIHKHWYLDLEDNKWPMLPPVIQLRHPKKRNVKQMGQIQPEFI